MVEGRDNLINFSFWSGLVPRVYKSSQEFPNLFYTYMGGSSGTSGRVFFGGIYRGVHQVGVGALIRGHTVAMPVCVIQSNRFECTTYVVVVSSRRCVRPIRSSSALTASGWQLGILGGLRSQLH